MERPARSPEWTEAGMWALDRLDEFLGRDWPELAWRSFGLLPVPLGYAAGHVVAYAQILELALRLRLLRDVEGWGDVRRDLRQDRRSERALHVSVQLETAASGLRLGWPVRLEPPGSTDGKPADVCFDGPAGLTTAEAKALLPSASADAHHRGVDAAIGRLTIEAAARGLILGGELDVIPTDNDIAAVLAWMTDAAGFVRAGGTLPAFSQAGFNLCLTRSDDPNPPGLRGPRFAEDLLGRLLDQLRHKGRQAAAAGASWLRVDVLTGLWRFTTWGRLPLPAKLAQLSQEVRAALADRRSPQLHGVVLCSAAGLHLGDVAVEQTRLDDGLLGLRQAVLPQRARECLVISLAPDGHREAEDWSTLLDARAAWLPWALAQADLPDLERILATERR